MSSNTKEWFIHIRAIHFLLSRTPADDKGWVQVDVSWKIGQIWHFWYVRTRLHRVHREVVRALEFRHETVDMKQAK